MDNNEKKKAFHETLAELIEYATVSGNRVTKEDVQRYFQDLVTDESMYTLIYGYLTDAKINVEGFDAPQQKNQDASANTTDIPDDADPADSAAGSQKQKTPESNEALFFHEMYLDELAALTKHEDSQISGFLKDLVSGDLSSVSAITEHYLPLVIRIADRFDDLGLSHSDLVAEGNLALYEAILAYPETQTSTDLSDFEAFLDKEVYDSLLKALNIEIGSNRVSNHLADQVNALNDASTELAKELGREATLEELCERLALSTDEVKELMKISIDALTVIQSDDELKK